MITTVVFDLGGVLCRFDPEARIRALAAASGWSVDSVRDHVWGSGRDAEADRGALSRNAAFALASLEGALDEPAVLECWKAAFAPDGDVLALVDRVLVPAALLTNNGPVVEALFVDHLAAVAARCSPVMLSWRLGATKPSREVYDRAAATLARAPDELVMVDDTRRNVDGALAAGWDAIHFTGPGRLAAELGARGVTAG